MVCKYILSIIYVLCALICVKILGDYNFNFTYKFNLLKIN